MSLCMAFTMSIIMSLIGTLLSGHFSIASYLIGFAISFVISLVIGFLVPMKQVSDNVCEKFGAKPETMKARVISALVSDVIYTPIITVCMCFIMTTFAGMGIERQAALLESQINELSAQSDALTAQIADLKKDEAANTGKIKELEGQIGGMQSGIAEMTGARNGMLASKPSFIREVWLSLLCCFIAGFILAFIVQPIYLKAIMKHYKIIE